MASLTEVSDWSPPLVALGTEIITILVGPLQTKFTIHKNLISACSNRFRSELETDCVEAHVKILFLPTVDPELFDVLHRWLYNAHLAGGEPLLDERQLPDAFWLEIYHVAYELEVPGLQLLAVHELRSMFSDIKATIPSPDFIIALFKSDVTGFMQAHIVKHISYWVPKTKKREVWQELYAVNPKFTLAMVTELSNSAVGPRNGLNYLPACHPSQTPNYGISSGFDYDGLKFVARIMDVKVATESEAQVLAEAEVDLLSTFQATTQIQGPAKNAKAKKAATLKRNANVLEEPRKRTTRRSQIAPTPEPMTPPRSNLPQDDQNDVKDESD